MKSSALLAAGLAFAPAALADWPEAVGKSLRFSTVTGYFLQDETDTNPSGFDYAKVNFGLLDRDYPTDKRFDADGDKTQWQRFQRWVDYLNSRCHNDGSAQYKLFFLGRHGEGWHNAAESFYGTPNWNCYWAEQTGNGTARWADAHLTPAGLVEAYKANAYFKDRYETQKMPQFESYYSSPLSRCTITANLTFGDIEVAEEHPFIPTIKEGFREGMTVHTCNWRSNKTYIQDMFPSFEFEPGFTEFDQLWHGDLSETGEAEDVRAHNVLDDVFRSDDNTWLSVTAHSGIISRLLKAVRHREFRLSTGQIIPVLVKAEAIELLPDPTYDALEPYSTCDAPPIESIAGVGCICSSTTASFVPAPTA